MGNRSEQGKRVRPVLRSYEENNHSDLTKRSGKMWRSTTGAVDQLQIRQPPGTRAYNKCRDDRSCGIVVVHRIQEMAGS